MDGTCAYRYGSGMSIRLRRTYRACLCLVYKQYHACNLGMKQAATDDGGLQLRSTVPSTKSPTSFILYSPFRPGDPGTTGSGSHSHGAGAIFVP